jgi:hypothetical protein
MANDDGKNGSNPHSSILEKQKQRIRADLLGSNAASREAEEAGLAQVRREHDWYDRMDPYHGMEKTEIHNVLHEEEFHLNPATRRHVTLHPHYDVDADAYADATGNRRPVSRTDKVEGRPDFKTKYEVYPREVIKPFTAFFKATQEIEDKLYNLAQADFAEGHGMVKNEAEFRKNQQLLSEVRAEQSEKAKEVIAACRRMPGATHNLSKVLENVWNIFRKVDKSDLDYISKRVTRDLIDATADLQSNTSLDQLENLNIDFHKMSDESRLMLLKNVNKAYPNHPLKVDDIIVNSDLPEAEQIKERERIATRMGGNREKIETYVKKELTDIIERRRKALSNYAAHEGRIANAVDLLNDAIREADKADGFFDNWFRKPIEQTKERFLHGVEHNGTKFGWAKRIGFGGGAVISLGVAVKGGHEVFHAVVNDNEEDNRPRLERAALGVAQLALGSIFARKLLSGRFLGGSHLVKGINPS